MSELLVQRRTRRRWVQIQARLEAGAGDRVIPLVIAAALTTVLALTSLARPLPLDWPTRTAVATGGPLHGALCPKCAATP